MTLSVVQTSVNTAYEILDSLPSMHLASLQWLNAKAHSVIIDALMQLRIARDAMADMIPQKPIDVVPYCRVHNTTAMVKTCVQEHVLLYVCPRDNCGDFSIPVDALSRVRGGVAQLALSLSGER